MKKQYSDVDKSDLPLESSSTAKSTTKSSTKTTKSATNSTATKKAKVNVISSKKYGESKSSTKPKTQTKTTQKKQTKPQEVKSLRSTLASDSIDMMDLEKLNEENINTRGFRSKRNRVIIIILSLLVAVSVAVIAIYASTMIAQNNCFVYSYGDTTATYLIDGEETEEFRSPPSLKGNRIYEFNTEIYIHGTDTYNIKFSIDVYMSGELLSNILVYEPNLTLFTRDTDGYYHSREAIQGGQTIKLCEGVILDREYEQTLNDDNFTLKFNTYFEKV